MATRLKSKLVGNLTPDEYKACHRLNMGHRGTMVYRLEESRKRAPRRSRAIMIEDEEGLLLAWALLFPYGYGMRRKSKVPPKLVHIYVRSSCRRRHLGTRLLCASRRYIEHPEVSPWDARSGAFYASFKYETISIAHGYKPAYRKAMEHQEQSVKAR